MLLNILQLFYNYYEYITTIKKFLDSNHADIIPITLLEEKENY